jgi:hypothetical protein
MAAKRRRKLGLSDTSWWGSKTILCEPRLPQIHDVFDSIGHHLGTSGIPRRLTAAIRYGPPLRSGHTRLASMLARLRSAGSGPRGRQ